MKMSTQGRLSVGAVALGTLLFGYGLFQFANSIRTSLLYERVNLQAQARSVAGQATEPRGVVLLLRFLESLRQETHEHLAHGLFGAAGGMTLLALGGRRLRDSRRPVLRLVDEQHRAHLRVAPAAPLDPEEAHELALLARFEALEQQARRDQSRCAVRLPARAGPVGERHPDDE